MIWLCALAATAQTFTLQGKVTDEQGNPVELATVSCLEQGAVTMANLNGEYSLKLHSEDSVVVKFSMVGYQTRQRVLRNPKSNQRLVVTLYPMKALDELSQNVHLLLERYEALQQENATLRLDIEKQRQELIRTHSELLELQQKNRRIATANALTAAESQEEAYKRINALIAQVDRAIAALKK